MKVVCIHGNEDQGTYYGVKVVSSRLVSRIHRWFDTVLDLFDRYVGFEASLGGSGFHNPYLR